MPLVFGACLKYLKNEEESKDAVMQIFEQLIDKLRIHEVSNFKSWLYTLTRNHCLMIIRQAWKQTIISFDTETMENAQFMHPVEDGNEGQLLLMEDCMGQLIEEQRKCIQLFYLERTCYKDVARLTGYDMLKVKSHIQNGKRNLKICMDKKSGK